jgi:hypothetical protein
MRRGLRCAQWPGVTPRPLTQCTSRPHFEQFGTHVSSSRQSSSAEGSRPSLDDAIGSRLRRLRVL